MAKVSARAHAGFFVALLSVTIWYVLSTWQSCGRDFDFWRTLEHIISDKEVTAFIAEPRGLAEQIASIPPRRLTKKQLAALQQDGAVLLKKVVPDRGLLQQLEQGIWPHAVMNGVHQELFEINGYIRALVRDSSESFAAMASQVLKHDDVWLFEAPTFGMKNVQRDFAEAEWHHDAMDDNTEGLMISFWLAITDAPNALEFLAGSHRYLRAIEDKCKINSYNEKGRLWYKMPHDCIIENFREDLAEDLGHEPWMSWPHMQAGDVIMFNGNVLHRGIFPRDPRLAIALRYWPWMFGNRTWDDTQCVRPAELERKYIFPRTEKSADCLRWQMWPLEEQSPFIPPSCDKWWGAIYNSRFR